MSKYPVLPLIKQKNIEQQASWEGLSTPSDLADYMARVLSVDPNQLLQFQEAVYSDVQPTGLEAKKLWIKTDAPQAIGIPSGDGYVLIHKYPQGVPFLWIYANGNLPTYLDLISDSDLDDYGLTAPPDEDTAAWVIFH